MTSFKSFPLYQDISLLSFVPVKSSTLIRCGWVFINARPVENCISVEGLNALKLTVSSAKHQKICIWLIKDCSH